MAINFLDSINIAGLDGGVALDVQGSQGQLFSVTDDLSGDIFAVSDISGVPILNVNSNGTSYFDGKLGIGTASPQYPLHVAGSSSATAPTGNGVLMGLYGGNYGHIQMNGSAGSYIDFSQSGVDHKGRILYDNAANYFRLDTNGAEKMRITSAGNVGIGTTSPGAKLHVDSSTAFSLTSVAGDTLFLSDDTIPSALNGVGASIGFSGPQEVQRQAAIAALRTGGDHDNIGLAFYTHPGSSNDETIVEKLRIDHDGNVGIGTTSPLAILDIQNLPSGGSGTILNIGLDASNPVRAKIHTESYNGAFSLYDSGSNEDVKITTSGNSYFNGGNVGIGTTSPGYKLDIAGALRATGESTFTNNLLFPDNSRIKLGAGNDLQIYHDGGNSYINETGTGNLFIQADSQIRLGSITGSEKYARFNLNGNVELFYDNAIKFETTTTGVTVTGDATATTFLGDLNGTINTATTAVTQANATDNTTVATTAFVQNLIGTIPAGLVFQGTWNAATNTPTLASGSGTTGHFYIVSTSGSTNLDGVTDWVTGDWAVFIEQGGTDAWEKIDNSSVLDGAGTGQTVALWSGSGTSNTLTNAPITVSGNNATFAGKIRINATTTTGLEIASSSGATSGLKLFNNSSTDAASIINHYNGDLLIGTNNATVLTMNGTTSTFAGDVTTLGTFNVQRSAGGTPFDNFKITTGDVVTTLERVENTGDISGGYGRLDFKTNAAVGVDGAAGRGGFKFIDGAGVQILYLENSDASATFAGDVNINGGDLSVGNSGTVNSVINMISTNHSFIEKDTGNDLYFANNVGDKDIKFRVKDNATNIIALTLDGSEGGNATFAGDVIVDSALLSNQENTDIDSAAAEMVAQVAHATYTAAFFDFVVKKVGNVRSGTVYACHDGTNVEFTETSTQDLGDTSDVVLSVDISGTQMRLMATVTSDDWIVKSLVKAI